MTYIQNEVLETEPDVTDEEASGFGSTADANYLDVKTSSSRFPEVEAARRHFLSQFNR